MAVEEYDIVAGEQSKAISIEGKSDAVDSSRRILTWESVAVLPLIFILLLGAYFRFTGLNWDDNHHLHPDERFLTDIAYRLQTISDPLTYLRTSESPLNPYNLGNVPLYVYGNFPMTVTRYVAEWTKDVCAAFSELCPFNPTAYDGIHLVGRFLSGFVDLISIFFLFLIGRRLYDWRVGLLGALLLALAVMPIQQAHFFTMDNWAAALTTVSMYMAVRAAEAGDRKRWWILFGLFLGLAVASRINMAPLAAMAVVAAVIWLAKRERAFGPARGWRYVLVGQGSLDLQRVVIGVLLAAIVSVVVFRLAQPYAFADATIVREQALMETGREPSFVRVTLGSILGFNPKWLANMKEIQNLQSPEASFPPALQWTSRTPLLFPLNNMVLYGMGLTAGVAAWLGFLWALWRILKAHPDWTVHVLPVAWTGSYFLFMGTRWVKSIRYFLPIYPLLLLLAAWALIELWQRAEGRAVKRATASAVILLTVIPTLLWADAFVEIYQKPMTRIAASRWMFENIPTGATLVYNTEQAQEELHLPLKGFQFEPEGFPLDLTFAVPQEGAVDALRFNYVMLPGDATTGSTALRFTLLDSDGDSLLTTEELFAVNGGREAITFDLPEQQLEPGKPYLLRVEHLGGDIIIADTTRIVNEEWDDSLPVNVDGRAAYAAYYSEVSGGHRPVTWPASEEKRDLMLQWIDEADVIALSSQRSLWNTPRLPLTYPLNIAYYEALFNGELGFELIGQFHADIHVGPLYVSDTGGELAWGQPPEIGWPPPGELAAEEAFSVYDHPPIWIFRKTDAYDPAKAREILSRVDLDEVVVMNPAQATKVPNGLMLSALERTIQQANGTFHEVFAVDGLLSRQPALGAIVWWTSVIVLGWLAFPIAFTALPGLPSRGYALSRVLGLLLLSWSGWILASYKLLPNNRTTLLLLALLLGMFSLLLFLRQQREIVAFLRQNLTFVAITELVSLLLFLFAIGIRLGNPDVWDVIWGGEKPMDLSYFTAVVKSTTFPPYDPWYAGGYLNYYYYGFVFVGALTELLGIVPTVAYNLILPMLFSFTGIGVFSVAYNLVRKLETRRTAPDSLNGHLTAHKWHRRALLAGAMATILCIFIGNLGEFGVMVGAWERASDSEMKTGIGLVDKAVRTIDGALAVTIGGREAPIYPGDWFWTATRAISVPEGETAPITEFPFFTFLYGDLHAHMIALPLALLALAWAVSVVLHSEERTTTVGRQFLTTASVWFAGALAIGVLRPTNTWDWPTYLLLGSLAVVYAVYARNDRNLDLPMLGRAVLQVAALALLSTLLFWPFIANFGSGYNAFKLWEGSYTTTGDYLVIYGLFLLLILTHLAREFRAWSNTWTQESLIRWRPFARPILLLLGVYVFLLLVLVIAGYWIAPIALTLTLFAGVLASRPNLPTVRRIILTLISGAFGLTFLVELVVLEGDIGRMNTVFKFYMQVWVMLSIAGGVAFALAWPVVKERWGRRSRQLWQGTLALLLAAAFLYPLLAIPAKWKVRMSDEAPTTLDGMAFMKTTSYQDTAFDGSSVTIELIDEYEALRWMQRNVEGSPVVAEAHSGNPYRSIASRVAMYTGLPTVVGWDWHQQQQRAAAPGTLVLDRVRDVERLYNTTDIQEALGVIEEYGVKYIYAGTLEWTYYHPQGLVKFDQMVDGGLLREVYRNKSVSIYEVVQ